MNTLSDDRRPIVSSWICDQEALGSIASLTPQSLSEASRLPPLNFLDRAKRLLVWMAKRTVRLGEVLDLNEIPAALSTIQSFSPEDLGFVARHLAELGWLKPDPVIHVGYLVEDGTQIKGEPLGFSVTGEGWKKIDEWSQNPSRSNQGFVAMWFDSSMDDAWISGLREGIRSAGYNPQRIDLKEHSNKICDEIIAEIRQSKFIVADFTGQRAGVYFEAGFALGLGIPVIWTCKKDELKILHFDVRQYNCIDWEEPSELRERLAARISAVIGRGPLPPV